MFLTFAQTPYATTQTLPRPLKAELVAIVFVLASLSAYLLSQATPISAASLMLGVLVLMLLHGVTGRQILTLSIFYLCISILQFHRLIAEDCSAMRSIIDGSRSQQIKGTIARLEPSKRLLLARLEMPSAHVRTCASSHTVKIETFMPSLTDSIYSGDRSFSTGDSITLTPAPIAEPITRPQSAIFPGRFDQRSYLQHFKVFYVLKVRAVNKIARSRSALIELDLVLDKLRRSLAAMHVTALGANRGALMTSMVIGDKVVAMPREIVDDFRQAGLSHLLSASGLNLAILSGALALIFRHKGTFYLALHLALMGLFASLAGFGSSICRAAMMSLAGHLLRPLIPGMSSGFIFALVAAIALSIDPSGLGDLGFVFSYLACAGIVHLLPSLDNLIQLKGTDLLSANILDTSILLKDKIKRWTLDPLLLVACSLAACLPFQAAIFKTASAWTFAANFLIEPLVVPISILGFTSSILFCLNATYCQPLCSLLDGIASPLLDTALSIAHFFAGLPLHDLALAPPDNMAIVLYGLGLASFATRYHQCRKSYTSKAVRSLTLHFLLASMLASILLLQCLLGGAFVEAETRPDSIAIRDGDKHMILHFGDKDQLEVRLDAAPYILRCSRPRLRNQAPHIVLIPAAGHRLAWASQFLKPVYFRYPIDQNKRASRQLMQIKIGAR